MRTVLASLLLAAIASTATGCLGCSAYSGGGDQVYARGSDQMILCENGTYSIELPGKTLEGFYHEVSTEVSTTQVVGTDGATDMHAFDLTIATDGTATSSELGAGAWTEVPLDKTGLDHADTLCQDLATRAWYAGR